MNRTSTRELFRRAVDVVRSAPLDGPGRVPAYLLPSPEQPPAPAAGPVEGLDGDLWDTADGLREGRISAVAVLEACRERVTRYDERYGAFEYIDAAAFVPRPIEPGLPLAGVPLTVKDVIHVAGMPTAGSSVAIRPIAAERDGEAVARLRAAGAHLIGKVVTHEFALGVTTAQSRNPWDDARVPGGSSGGSAISVVTGMALGSLGTDTRASIRVPAALCGLVGFKPSYGRVPVDEWLTLSWSLDHLAPMGRTVRDVALLMDVIAGPAGSWSGALPGCVEGLRVGTSAAFLDGCEPGVRACFDTALAGVRTAGAVVIELEALSREDLELANAVGMILSRAEAAQFHLEMGTDLDRCVPDVRDQLMEALGLMATDLVRAFRLRGMLRDRLASAFSGVDIVAMPTSKVVAPRREDADQYLLVLSANCIPWSLVDFPAISVHMGLSEGLPVGLQLVSGPGSDRSLLATACAFERILPRPPAWSPR